MRKIPSLYPIINSQLLNYDMISQYNLDDIRSHYGSRLMEREMYIVQKYEESEFGFEVIGEFIFPLVVTLDSTDILYPDLLMIYQSEI